MPKNGNGWTAPPPDDVPTSRAPEPEPPESDIEVRVLTPGELLNEILRREAHIAELAERAVEALSRTTERETSISKKLSQMTMIVVILSVVFAFSCFMLGFHVANVLNR